MAISVGSTAPDFTLKSKTSDGLVDVTLSGNYDNINSVLLFFPFAFTGVCMEEACSVRDDLPAFSELNASVYGISVDSPFAQEAMANEKDLNFPLLSDFNKDVSKAYDVLYDDFIGFQGVAKRSAFIINMSGDIAYSWSSDDPKQLPEFQAIKDSLSRLG